MGIVRGSARLMLDEARRQPFSGAVLQLARTSVFFRQDELAKWAQMHGVPLAADVDVRLSHDPRLASQGCLSDVSFFRLLGFEEVVSADVSGYEEADVIWDLNEPAPAALRDRFDVVIEAGTIQHVFDQHQVFVNVHDVLKPGGRVIHAMSPSNNHVDHGFYMFSPTLFADVYRTFGYRIEAFFLFDFVAYWYHGRFYSTPFRIYAYEPGCLDHLCYGRWGNRQTGIFVVATKMPGASAAAAPQQSTYVQVWRDAEETGAGSPARLVCDPAAGRLVLAWKRLRETAARVLPKRLPPIVARY